MIYQVEKLLKEQNGNVPSDLGTQAETKISDLRQVMNTESSERIRSLTGELQQLYSQLTQASQTKADGTQTNQGNPSSHENPDGEVVEGDFHDA